MLGELNIAGKLDFLGGRVQGVMHTILHMLKHNTDGMGEVLEVS